MSKLNLNFEVPKERHEPTQNEIAQIEGLALSIEAIVKALEAYAAYYGDKADLGNVCVGVCNALELLVDPVIEYFSNYAGDAAPEKESA